MCYEDELHNMPILLQNIFHFSFCKYVLICISVVIFVWFCLFYTADRSNGCSCRLLIVRLALWSLHVIYERQYCHFFYTTVYSFTQFHTLSRVSSICRRCRHFSFHPFLCVRLGQSVCERPHIFPSSLLFINTNYCVESGVRLLLCIRNVYKWGPWSFLGLITAASSGWTSIMWN